MKKYLPMIVFVVMLLGMVLFPYIPLKIFNISLDSLSQNAKIWYNFICDIIFMGIIFLIYRKDMIKDFKKYIKNFGKNFELSFKYYFIGLVIMIISNLAITLFFSGANANNEDAVRNLISLYPIYMLFSVAIYAPFVEETIFRKCIKNSILAFGDNKITKYLYILISGLFFSAMHVVGLATSALDYLYIVPYLALGSAFAALYYKTDNIFSSISMHSLHNTAAIILYIAAGIL